MATLTEQVKDLKAKLKAEKNTVKELKAENKNLQSEKGSDDKAKELEEKLKKSNDDLKTQKTQNKALVATNKELLGEKDTVIEGLRTEVKELKDAAANPATVDVDGEEIPEAIYLHVKQQVLLELKDLTDNAEPEAEDKDETPKPRRFTPQLEVSIKGSHFRFRNNKNSKTGFYTKAWAEAIKQMHESRNIPCEIQMVPQDYHLLDLEDEKVAENAEIYLVYEGSTTKVERTAPVKTHEHDATYEEAEEE